jgi:hypothetical protein
MSILHGCVGPESGSASGLSGRRFVRTRGCLAAFLLAGALAQAQQPAPPAAVFSAVLSDLKQRTPIPVLLPARLPAVLARSVYARVETAANGYTIRLESEPDCNGNEVCFVGSLKAEKGGAFTFPEAVQIDKVVQARFQPSSCVGTCTLPAIEWKVNGVLYTVQLSLRSRNAKDQRAELVQLASSATRSGAR